MTHSDLTLALKALNWKYQEASTTLVFEEVKNLPLCYEDLLRIGIKAKNAPAPKSLIKYIRELVAESQTGRTEMYYVIRLDSDDEYHRPALEWTLKHNIISSMLTIGMEDISQYLGQLPETVSRTVYEIAFVYLWFREYPHNLPVPAMDHPELWASYGVGF